MKSSIMHPGNPRAADIIRTVTNRFDKRKQRTRAVLIGAAQQYLASTSTSVSIQELTDAADVGFGSFYNHFDSKDDLFAAALTATLDAWAEKVSATVDDLEDPAEIFAVSFRMTGRLQRAHPELVRVILRSGTSTLTRDRGLRTLMMDDLRKGMDRGRFVRMEPDVAAMIAGGALLGLLRLLNDDPARDGDALSDAAAERVLVMLGIDAVESARLTGAPLPHYRSALDAAR